MDEKMKKIAEDERNRVLKWEWDQVDRVLTSAQVRQMMEYVREEFFQLISSPEESANLRRNIKAHGKEAENDRLRKLLVESNPKTYNSFIKTNPSFFAEATKLPPLEPEASAADAAEMQAYREEILVFRKGQAMVDFMLRMKEEVESGKLTQMQASQLVQRAALKTFAKEEDNLPKK